VERTLRLLGKARRRGSQLQLKRINIQDAHLFEHKLTKASKDLDT